MLIVSQNKERVLCFGGTFNALEYAEGVGSKGKKGTVRHTICISDGCPEEIAEYPTRERCLVVLKDFCETYKEECYSLDFYDVGAQATRLETYRQNKVFEFPEE